MTRRDPVTPEVAQAVLSRDGKCIAPWIDPDAGPCRGRTTMEHVQDEAGMGKPRAKSDPDHLVALCEGHHLESRKGRVWASARKAYTRMYLRFIRNGMAPRAALLETRRCLIEDHLEVYE